MAEKMELPETVVWDGNFAAANALRQAQIDVVAAYPITPSTPIVEGYGKFVADGYIDGEFVMVESEHAAMSGCVGAAAAGGRVATATSSQGFALMVEVLYQASGMRLPIVLCVVNRALASPLNVRGDHGDMYLGRDSGWLQIDAFNSQEAYDLTLCAFKIGEAKSVRLPVMVHQDGFITSHTAQNVKTISDDKAFNFVGKYEPINEMLDFSQPITYGAQTEEDWHYEHKARQHKAIIDARPVIDEVFAEFKKLTGREYNRVENYMMDDAEVAIIALGTTVESARIVAEELRANSGIKAGVIAPRVIRPFPFDDIRDSLKGVKAVACFDRSSPGGALGMLYNEVAGALFAVDEKPILTNYIYGLGGRDLTLDAIQAVYENLDKDAKSGKRSGKVQQFLSLRGPKIEFFE
jgi:pyruvate ferredoxin oxidoreductase alpha subunit